AKIFGEVAVPASNSRRIALHLPKQALVRFGELSASLEHQAPFHEVGARGDQYALGFETVSPGSPGLLLVMLERPRRSHVNDEPDMRPVDAHAEGHRRYDDINLLVQERVLIATTLPVQKPGVIRQRRRPERAQPRG